MKLIHQVLDLFILNKLISFISFVPQYFIMRVMFEGLSRQYGRMSEKTSVSTGIFVLGILQSDFV